MAKVPGHEFWPARLDLLPERLNEIEYGAMVNVHFFGLGTEGVVSYVPTQMQKFVGTNRFEGSRFCTNEQFDEAMEEARKQPQFLWWPGDECMEHRHKCEVAATNAKRLASQLGRPPQLNAAQLSLGEVRIGRDGQAWEVVSEWSPL